MRLHRLTPIIVSVAILAVIILTVIQLRSVVAQQDRAAKAPVSTDVTQQQVASEGGGFTSVPQAETTSEKDTDLYLDADEVENLAKAEQSQVDQSSAAAAVSQIPVSFKHVPIPLPGGIDHAVAGVATRNSGQEVIRLRGVPPGSTLLSALLVWGEISNGSINPYNVRFGQNCTVCTNGGALVAGSPLPFPNNPAVEPCWNPAGQFWAYIANVTAQIAPGINGDYQIRGLRSAITNNRCPWGDAPGCADPGNALVLSEGASLIVLYSNPCIPRAAQLFIDLGPQEFSGALSVVHNTLVTPIRPNLPNLKHSRIGADGQVSNANCGLRALTFATDERTWIENIVTGGSIQIKGDVGGLNRDSDWNGYDGEPLNKLWDTHTDIFANSNFLAQGGGLGYRVRYLSQGDCIVWVAHILGVR